MEERQQRARRAFETSAHKDSFPWKHSLTSFTMFVGETGFNKQFTSKKVRFVACTFERDYVNENVTEVSFFGCDWTRPINFHLQDEGFNEEEIASVMSVFD